MQVDNPVQLNPKKKTRYIPASQFTNFKTYKDNMYRFYTFCKSCRNVFYAEHGSELEEKIIESLRYNTPYRLNKFNCPGKICAEKIKKLRFYMGLAIQRRAEYEESIETDSQDSDFDSDQQEIKEDEEEEVKEEVEDAPSFTKEYDMFGFTSPLHSDLRSYILGI